MSSDLDWNEFVNRLLPELLVSSCGVPARQAIEIKKDVRQRAADYAAGGRASRRALRAPFLDDVAVFEPIEAPPAVRADTAVVLRNSLLEEAHAHGPVEAGGLHGLTNVATAPLNAWLRENSNTEEDAAPVGVFAGAAAYPLGWRALQAMALAAEDGGHVGVEPGTQVDGAVTQRGDGPPDAHERSVIRSGLSALDEDLLHLVEQVNDHTVLVVASLSRYSRNSVLLTSVVDGVLSRGGTILTTNFMLTAERAHAREEPYLVAATHATSMDENFAATLGDTARLTKDHASTARRMLRQFRERAAG